MWMSRKESDSEPLLDDPSSHGIDQLVDTWFLKSLFTLTMGETFLKS